MERTGTFNLKRQKREPQSPEELALSLRTSALRDAIAKRKKQNKK